ncbi:hypothetical protein Tco_0373615 [Tanacetum coccineum]
MSANEGNNLLALMLFESPLDVEPLNMVEHFTASRRMLAAINHDVYPTHGHAAQEEIIPNMGFTLWSENQALMEANEELRSLVREMRRRESDALRLCDDLQDVAQTRDTQNFYLHERE